LENVRAEDADSL